jgi:signal transduction histidine kinase
MPKRFRSWIRNPRVQLSGDVALAFVLAASSVLPILVKHDPSWGTNEPVAILLALASTVPLASRSRWPLPSAAIILVANAGCLIAAAPHEAAFQPFVALTLSAYSVGSRYEGRFAVLAPCVLAGVGTVLFAAAYASGQHSGNLIPSLVWLAAAWAVGRVVRSWRHKAAELECLNHELEAQRDLQAQAAVAVERGRIARELHDVVAHNVSMMVVQAGAAERVLSADQPDVRDALAAIAQTGRETVDEMRTVLGVLRSEDGGASLDPQPGLGALEQLVSGVRQAGLPVSLEIQGEPAPLPQALDLSAFRIVQEALTNTLKHAGHAQAEVTVRYLPDSLELEIRDDGTAGAPGRGTGHGLIGMRERAAMFNGDFEAARSDQGFTVRARLPLGTVAQ